MRVDHLSLQGYRNYAEAEVDFDGAGNVISGKNAQGQTNLLEAVYLLSGGRSFRTRFDRELIGFDEEFASVRADVFSGERSQHIDILLRRSGRKTVTVNRVNTAAGKLAEVVNTVLFCPDDLNLLRDGPAARRRLLDLAICQLRPGYAQLLADYHRLYENKMRILRDYREDPAMLDTLDDFSDGLARTSARLIRYRAAYALRLAAAAAPIHRDFSGADEALGVEYRTVSTVTDPTAPEQAIYAQIAEHQRLHRAAELASGSCLTGAHKDDLEITVNGRSARAFASQGQTRTAALSLKLAEREIVLAETGEYPILLLDDVLSELDAQRQDFVLNRIGGGQTLITCCEDAQIAEKTGGRVIMIDKGCIL